MKYINKLAININVPVFPIDATITYQTIRKPTVFEKSILQLISQYNRSLGQYTIEHIANELNVLPVFFYEAIDHLINFKAIEKQSGSSLCAYNITQTGKDFLLRNQLPSNKKSEKNAFLYHPIKQLFINNDSISVLSTSQMTLSDELFCVSDQSMSSLASDAVHKTWAQPNTRINEIQAKVSDKRLLDTQSIFIEIDNNANLSINSYEPTMQKWLDSKHHDFIWQHLICPNLNIKDSDSQVSSIKWSDISAIYFENEQAFQKPDKETLITIINNTDPKNTIIEHQGATIDFSSQVQQAQLSQQTLTMPLDYFNDDKSLLKVTVDKNKNVNALYSGQQEIFFAHQPHIIQLDFQTQQSILWPKIETYLSQSNDIDAILFSSILDLKKAINRLPLSPIKQCIEYYQSIKNINPLVREHLFVEKFLPFEDIQDFEQLQSFVPDYEIPLNLLSQKIINHLINTAFKTQKVVNNIEFSAHLKQLCDAYFAIKNNSDNALLKPSLKLLDQIKHWHDSLERFYHQLPDLTGDNKNKLLDIKNGEIRQIEDRIKQLFAPIRSDRKQVVVLDTNCLMHHKEILTHIHANDFLVIPKTVLDELDGLKQDRDKSTPSKKSKYAREAITLLQTITKSEHYEDSHLELLSLQQANNDKHILSVALYYQLNQVLLISDDKNLRNLASAEGIRSVSSTKYMNHSFTTKRQGQEQ